MVSSSFAHLPRKWLLASLLILYASALSISVHGTSAYYFNPDEALHVRVAEGGSIGEVLKHSHFEANPPLGNLLRHYWIGFSENPGFVRAQSLLFYLGFISTCYLSGTLLGGRLCGLTMAFLAVFSHGCIIQSYSARVYMFFLFFLSSGFYAYLRWRQRRGTAALVAYAFCLSLAALTHFSAVFFVLCLGLFEAWRLARPWRTRLLAAWALANLSIVAVALGVYWEWRPYFSQIKTYTALLPPARASAATMVNYTLLNPLLICAYGFSGMASAVLLLSAMLAAMLLPDALLRNARVLKDMISLAAIALACGMVLFATRLYPVIGTRHGLWALPLIFPAAALLLIELCEWVAGIRAFERFSRPVLIALGLLFCLGWACQRLDDRFGDRHEYASPAAAWTDFEHYLEKLPPGTLIVGEKDDALLLANLYPYLSNDPASEPAAIVPYGNKRILINAHYFRLYSEAVFLDTMRSGLSQGAFDGRSPVVFLATAWNHSPVIDLMACSGLPKQVVTFPQSLSGKPLTRESLGRTPFAVITLSRATLLGDVLPEHGRWHGCMDARHDMTPFLHKIVERDGLGKKTA